ncbi:MAG TPA: BatA domain-containing protein [Cyclobacteriaceae bacterium]
MSFVYPSFLWALTALSIPIVIHLFNFRKTTRVYFSNTRFLKQIKQETTQKRKLKQYLVLASRLLFLLFLVLAFAQPFLPAKEQLMSGKNITVYLDNSYSMTAPVRDKVRAMDAATGFVDQITSTFPPDTRYRIITNDFAPFSNSYKTKSELLDILSQMRPSAVSRTFEEVKGRIEDDTNPAEVFWISDFQKSTMGELKGLQFDSIFQWHLVSLPVSNQSNIFIDSVYLENPLMIGGERNSIKVKLQNSGSKAVDGLMVKLTINNVQAATSSVNLTGNGSADASFDLTTNLKGLNQAKVSISDFPVSFDNDLYFTLNAAGKLKVVEIKNDLNPTFIQKVFGNTSLFTFQSQQSSNIDYSLLNEADLIVVNGIKKIDAGLLSFINASKDKSNSVFIIPATEPDLNSYKAVLPFLGLTLAKEQPQEELERPDFENPFFENVFEEKTNSLAMPRARKILQWGQDRSAIMKFKDGQPFLAQTGNLFVLASPLDKNFTDFYNHALFVPVMYRMATSVKKDQQKLYYTLTESLIKIKADSLFGEEPVRLMGSQEIIPPQRKTGDQVLIEIPKFSINAGYYGVMFKKDTLGLVAFDLDKRESALAQFSAKEVKDLSGGGDLISVFEVVSPEAFGNEIKERYLGTPLWKYALILALGFLLAEVLLIRFLK